MPPGPEFRSLSRTGVGGQKTIDVWVCHWSRGRPRAGAGSGTHARSATTDPTRRAKIPTGKRYHLQERFTGDSETNSAGWADRIGWLDTSGPHHKSMLTRYRAGWDPLARNCRRWHARTGGAPPKGGVLTVRRPKARGRLENFWCRRCLAHRSCKTWGRGGGRQCRS